MSVGALFLLNVGFLTVVGLFTGISHQKFIETNNLNKLSKSSDKQSDICTTTACQKAGKLIRDNINSSADPCDDFYAFACGGWMATHTIPPEKSRTSTFDELSEELQKNLKEELNKPSKIGDADSVIYALDLFKACIDNATRESRGVSPLLVAINSVGGWPLLGTTPNYDFLTYNWKDSLAKIYGYLGLSIIYSISVQPDANDTLVNRVYFDSSSFGLGRNQLVNTTAYPNIINAYKKYILQTALLLGAKNDSRTQNDIEDMLEFESQLAKLSTPPEDSRDAKVWYNRMSFKDFNNLTSNRVDWLQLTNAIYKTLNSSMRLNWKELVIVGDIPYYKGVAKLLDRTSNRVIANYFGWRIAMNFGSYTVQKFRDIAFEFNKVSSGVQKLSEYWKPCALYVSSALKYSVSRKYIEENFTPKDKEEISLLIKYLRDSFKVLVQESDWLDDVTKNKSLEKLDAMIENDVYPDWILDNQELDKYYKLKQKVDPKKAFEAILYLKTISYLNDFEEIHKPVNKTLSWPMPPAMVNAAYEPTQNSITFPAGILRPPFFDSQRPAYMNFGAIGMVIGHEITHGFDDQGSQFDKNGNLINWWSDQILKRFNEKSNCFVNQYGSIYDPNAKMKLNGVNTVGENIADNGGIRETFQAYQFYVQRNGEPQRLPYISEYTSEQILFLSFANVWCGLQRPEALKESIQYDPHSPGKYRINVPLSNFKSFSDAFNCKENSRMNPKDKCVLW